MSLEKPAAAGAKRPAGRPAGGAPPGGFPYRERQARVLAALREERIDLAVLADFEGMRSRSVRYLCGLPMDGLLFLSASGSLLVAWDVPLAERLLESGDAVADRLLPYAQFERSLPRAVAAVARELAGRSGDSGGGARIELADHLACPDVEEIRSALPDFEVLCRRAGLNRMLLRMRGRKDPAEIACLREAARITNRIIDRIEELLAHRRRKPLSELDLALRVEREARRLGAEGMGFETLAASPPRSFAIHAHPAFTPAPFGEPGFSILDFGVRWAGYTSDVTLTAVRPPLSPLQERMREAVEEAYRLAAGQIRPGVFPADVARRVDEQLGSRGFTMPHALGHGIGLDAHEPPVLRSRRTGEEARLEPGMVLTVEPGLYAPEAGGIRLENDLLVTGEGAETLTRSRLLQLPG